jgi:transposase-like protein
VVSYRCRECGAVSGVFTGTVLSGIRHDCPTIVMILRGFAQGVPTQHLSDELDLDYSMLLQWRHRLQASALEGQRTKAFLQKGTGTFENDRPPIHGVVGRRSGQVRLSVCPDTKGPTIEHEMSAKLVSGVRLCTDESHAYNRMGEHGYEHLTVCHGDGEYGRDEDGDDFCEIHCNTMEGIWTGLRNYLRRFRGVSKTYLSQYVAVFEFAYNAYNHSDQFWTLLRAMVLPDFTFSPT